LITGELRWLTDVGGGVQVEAGGTKYIVVESAWAALAGDPEPSVDPVVQGDMTVTSETPGVWTSVLGLNPDRHEAYVCNNHSDPNAIVLVRGGPYGVKPIWPDGPPFLAVDWKGAVQIMSPTHASVRCSISEV